MKNSRIAGLISLAWFWLGLNYCVFMIFVPLSFPQDDNALKSVSWFIGIPAVFAILGQNYFGYICLKKDRFRFLMVLSFVSFVILWVIKAMGVSNTWLYPYLAIHGFLVMAMIPSSKALITILFPEEKAQMIGRLYSFESIGIAISSVGIGLLLEKNAADPLAYQKLYGVMAIANIVFIPVYWLMFPKRMSHLKWDILSARAPGAILRIFNTPGIRHLYCYLVLVSCGSSFYFFYFGRYLKNILSGTETQVGLSMTLATLFGALSYPLYGKFMQVYGSYRGLLLCVISYVLCFLSLHFVTDPNLYLIIYALPLYPLMTVASNLFLANHTTEQDRGVGFGLLDTAFQTSGILAPLLGVLIFSFASLNQLALISIVILAPAVFFLKGLKT
ncbi:MAG: MFS transporter [Candidatus Cloacimonetes bacterium]|nr:MFS transporter [Candidatus Cloacimonadota bacterium]